MRSVASAKFVLTDSFHGVVFSILNMKNFAAILNHNDRDSRIINLINEFGIPSRMFNTVEEMLQTDEWKKDVDYSKCEDIIAKRVKEFQTYLLDVLNSIEKS